MMENKENVSKKKPDFLMKNKYVVSAAMILKWAFA